MPRHLERATSTALSSAACPSSRVLLTPGLPFRHPPILFAVLHICFLSRSLKQRRPQIPSCSGIELPAVLFLRSPCEECYLHRRCRRRMSLGCLLGQQFWHTHRPSLQKRHRPSRIRPLAGRQNVKLLRAGCWVDEHARGDEPSRPTCHVARTCCVPCQSASLCPPYFRP